MRRGMRPARSLPAAALALGLGAAYLAWRVAFSLAGAPWWLGAPALAVEVAGWLSLAALLVTLRRPARRADGPAGPTVDTGAGLVVVRVDGDRTVDDVRASLLSVGAVVDTAVVDHVGRAEVAAVAARSGAAYERATEPLGLPAERPVAPAWVLVVDAGDVLRADAAERLVAEVARDAALGVEVVQGLLRVVADDSAEHDAAGRYDRTFERETLNPALGARGAAVWTGSGALLTRAALDALRALPPSARRSELEASVALRTAGLRLVAPADHPVGASRPVNTGAAVRHRRRVEIAAARRLVWSRRNPVLAPGLGWRQRVALVAWCAHLLAGHRRAAFGAVVAVSLATGRLPFTPDPLALAALWLPWVVAASAAATVASGGTLRPGDQVRRSLRLLGPSFGRPAATAPFDTAAVRGGSEATGDRVLLGALAAVSAATVVRTVADLGAGAALPPAELAGLFAVALWFVGGGLDVLRLLARRSQRRTARRVPADLAASVNGEPLVLADLTPHGAGFLATSALAVGDRVELHVDLPRVTGPAARVVLEGTVRNRRVLPDGPARVGVSFRAVDEAAHDALVEHCAVAFPLRVLDRAATAAAAPADRYVPAPADPARTRGAFAPRFAALAMIAGVVTSLVPTLAPTASAASGTITVQVFRDHNANGARDTSGDAAHPAIDSLVPDVGLTASCVTGDGSYADPIMAAPVSTGTYAFTDLPGSPCRVELVNLPTGLQPGPLGEDNGGFVQFASAGSTVHIGVLEPAEFCQDNPTIVAACITFGDQIDGAHADFGALKAFPLTASGSAYDGTATHTATDLAEAREIGATFGAAYHRATRTIYVAAMTKVYAGFGPGGPGAVYAVAADGSGTTLAATIPNAGSLPARAGYAPSPDNVAGDWLRDGEHWDAVGTTSLGDIELTADGSTLWVVNLNDRSLYPVDVATGAVGAPAPVPPATGAAGACDPDWVRPFALGAGRDDVELLVGSVCAGPTAADLRAYVYAFFPADATFTTTPVFEADLTYEHGRPGNWCGPDADGDWNPWTATNMFDGTGPISECAWPQPMLTDLELDDDGSLVLGLRDRFGDQSGEDVPPGPNGGGGEGVAAGDLLRACPAAGGWLLESNGTCGGVTGAAVGSAEGPGGGEFYSDNFAQPTGFGGNHQEITIGGLAKIPGVPSMLVTAFDPSTDNPADWRSGGVRTMDSRTGEATRFFNLFDKCDTSGWDCAPGRQKELTFGKVNGLGDLVALCDQAPVEIGDLVWFDADANGRQDAGEAPIAGVTVTVEIDTDDDGRVDVTTQATTNAAGRWVVSSDGRPAGERSGFGADDDYGIDVLAGGARVVVVAPTSVVHLGQTVVLTAVDAAGAAIDSDAERTTGRTASFVIAGPGANDHTWDVGYTVAVAPPPSTSSSSSSTSSSTSPPPTNPPSSPAPPASSVVPTTAAATTTLATTTVPPLVASSIVAIPSSTVADPITAGSGSTNGTTGSTGGSLPRTGAGGVLSLSVIALALLLAGSVLVGAAGGRRRDRSPA